MKRFMKWEKQRHKPAVRELIKHCLIKMLQACRVAKLVRFHSKRNTHLKASHHVARTEFATTGKK